MIDADVLLGHYPFRPFARSSTDLQQIKAYLQSHGIERACLSSLHAVFYADPQQGNAEVFPLIKHDDFFLPVATINPALHNWAETLARCVGDYGCRMVRLLPNYHLYDLSEPFVDDFLTAAHEHDLLVGIVKRIEDERMHPLLMKVPAVANHAIVALTQRYPAPLLIFSAFYAEIQALAVHEQLYFDIALAETLNTMARLGDYIAPERLVFSSHTPFLYAAAATGKLDNWQTSAQNGQAVRRDNLTRLLKLARLII